MHGSAMTAIGMFAKPRSSSPPAAWKKLTPSYLRSVALVATLKTDDFKVPDEIEAAAEKAAAKTQRKKGPSKYAGQLKKGVGYHHRYNINFTDPMKSNEMTHLHQNELSHHLRKQKWLTKSSNASKALLIKYRKEQQMKSEKIARVARKLKDTLKEEGLHSERRQKADNSRRRKDKMRAMIHRKDLRSERPKTSVENARDVVMAWNTKKKDGTVSVPVFMAAQAAAAAGAGAGAGAGGGGGGGGGGGSGGGGVGSSSNTDGSFTTEAGVTVEGVVDTSGVGASWEEDYNQKITSKYKWLKNMVDTQEQRKTAFWVQQEMQKRQRLQRRQQV
jgi:hypothetical protein